MRNNQSGAEIGWDAEPTIPLWRRLIPSATRPHRRAWLLPAPPWPKTALCTEFCLLPLCLQSQLGHLLRHSQSKGTVFDHVNVQVFIHLFHLVKILPWMLCHIFTLEIGSLLPYFGVLVPSVTLGKSVLKRFMEDSKWVKHVTFSDG